MESRPRTNEETEFDLCHQDCQQGAVWICQSLPPAATMPQSPPHPFNFFPSGAGHPVSLVIYGWRAHLFYLSYGSLSVIDQTRGTVWLLNGTLPHISHSFSQSHVPEGLTVSLHHDTTVRHQNIKDTIVHSS